jgi:hypothetical protein
MGNRTSSAAVILSGITLLVVFTAHLASASSLSHGYSFENDASDSIGTAHGTVLGNAVITNGSLLLNGTNGVVQLPANLFTNSKSLTLECWFVSEQNLASRHLWSFGGSPMIAFLLRGAATSEYRSRGYYGSQTVNTMVDAFQLSHGKHHHLVWTQDEASRNARIYLNGMLYAQHTNFAATPGTTTASSYLGGAGSSTPIKGSISEFRIYSNALSHLDVLRNKSAGPDTLPADGDVLTNLTLRVGSHLALNSTTRPLVFADFTHQQALNVTLLDTIVFTSSDTNVVNPSTNGYMRAVGLGNAEVIASYGSLSATSTVTVVAANQFGLAHRYNFDGRLASSQAADLAGSAPGVLVNGGALTNGQQLYFDGANDHVDLPDGIISSLSAVTFEAWVTGFALNGQFPIMWPRVFDFGSGGNYLFLAPSVYTDNLGTNTQFIRFAATTNGIAGESPRLTARPWMLDGFETHLAVTYDPPANSSKLYINGVLADTGLARYPLSIINDTNNWLGRSQYSHDTYFRGLFNEFRIYRTALTASDVAASYALGPDVIGADYALHATQTGNSLTLSWGPSASWLVLKASVALGSGATWTNAGLTPVFTNGRLEAVVPLNETSRYFRLAPQ